MNSRELLNQIRSEIERLRKEHLGSPESVLNDVETFIESLEQQEPQELDEAAEKYEQEHTIQRYDGGGFTPDSTVGIGEAFIAGAKWMAEQLEEVLLIMAEKGLVPYKDGNAWCILLGDNLQEGVSGFGDTITEAMMDFLKDAIVQGIVKEGQR